MKFTLPSGLGSIVNKLADIVKRTPDEQNAFNKFRAQTQYRTRQDTRDYDQAIQAAESVINPNRNQLYRLYKNIETDTHLTSTVQSRRLMATSAEFRVVKKTSGKEKLELTALLQAAWFQQVLEHFWDSILYGYSLVQLNDLDADMKFQSVELVPRENVKPWQNLIVQTPADSTGYDYSQNSWVVGAGRPKDLGLYMKAAKLILFKFHAASAWAQFVELFGMPYRVGKTDMGSPDLAQAMYKMLGEMGGAGYAVIDKDEDVTWKETKGTGASPHQLLIQYIDTQMSKLMWGQTMMSDNGSSRSQAEVHQDLAGDYVRQDQRTLTNYVNDSLFPKLIELGFPFQGYRFEFYEPESELTLDQVLSVVNAGLQVEPEWFSDKFNIPLVKPEPVPTALAAGQPAAADGEPVGEDPKTDDPEPVQ